MGNRDSILVTKVIQKEASLKKYVPVMELSSVLEDSFYGK